MARIKHIALVTDDPAKTAEFYKQHFGLTELYRRPSNTGERGVWLSDGYIYFAILRYGDADAPKLGITAMQVWVHESASASSRQRAMARTRRSSLAFLRSGRTSSGIRRETASG